MFEDEQGFLQTLSGSYLLLTNSAAYGQELTIGFPEEIVHYWQKEANFTSLIIQMLRWSAVWMQLGYKCIKLLQI